MNQHNPHAGQEPSQPPSAAPVGGGLIQQVMASMATVADLSICLDETLALLTQHLGLQSAVAYLWEDDHLALVVQRSTLGSEWPVKLSSEIGKALLPQVALVKPDLISDTPLLPREGALELLSLPLVSRNDGLGWLLLAGTGLGTLPPALRNELGLVGQIVGLYVCNSRLELQMLRQLRESQTIYKVSRAFVSTPELDSLLNLIVRSAVDTIVKANNCVLHLYDEATDSLHARALSFVGQVRRPSPSKTGMRLGEGVAGAALMSGRVINVPDISVDPRFVRSSGEKRSFAAMMVAPLRLGERRIGTLSVDSHQTNAFSSEDVRLLMTLATQAAAAIENARLVRDLQQSLDDLRHTQAQLIQSEKLSAIGQLIAGVAHELNNPLTAVMGYAQLLRSEDHIDQEVRRDLDKIYGQAQRAAKIVENLLTFARQQKIERQVIDVNKVLDSTLELRIYQLQVENIALIKQLDGRPMTASADPNQLQQVFLNLINNAQDAMVQHRGGGQLVVRTELIDDKIQIRFTDNGPGLSLQARQHLFEPFFTTKEVGKGTGLGLSICFGIVSQYGGRIWAEEAPEQGASFVVELPLVAQELAPVFVPELPLDIQTRGKRILIVDDEVEVAEVLTRILLHDKHHVATAQDGEAALGYLNEANAQGMPFDLIISDIKMPGLDGPELYERIRQEAPAMLDHVIFITGDTLSPSTHDFLQSSGAPFLTKPFKINELRQLTDSLLR